MDIKVNQVQQPVQIEQPQQAQETDGTFKFTLVSRIEEQDAQNALMQMMEKLQGRVINLPNIGILKI